MAEQQVWQRTSNPDGSRCPICAAFVVHTSPTGAGDREQHSDWHIRLTMAAHDASYAASMFRPLA